MNGKILLFSGTTEGRMLMSHCIDSHIYADVSLATDYDEELESSEFIKIIRGRKNSDEIAELIVKEKYALVMDATHPYATEVTENIIRACRQTDTLYYRVIRDMNEKYENAVYVDDLKTAVKYLSDKNGKVFISTGSKGISELSELCGRSIVRVLDSQISIDQCRQAGFENIITGKGPFSTEENIEHFRGCSYLITKDSGKNGGVPEKIKAAEILGIKTVIIKRPQENGIGIEEAKKILNGEDI